MKSKKSILKVFLILGLLFSGIIAYGVYWVFFDWSRFKDELINQSTSPNGTYTINAYLSPGECIYFWRNENPK